MTRRALLVALAFCLGVVLVQSALAQDRAIAQPPDRRPDRSPLELRVQELEREVARLKHEVVALKERAGQPDAPPAERAQIKVYTLKKADAIRMTRIIQELFDGGQRARLRVVADERTNSVIAVGHPNDLEVIEAIINRLDLIDPPARPEPRRPEKRRDEEIQRLPQDREKLRLKKEPEKDQKPKK
ncbi:MAG TPA: secretin N-terminal domain-containing protein [Gemmataceae bacterium]|nr:secretin N-terminal domain-containing protein [Gemmataceae bacterium]